MTTDSNAYLPPAKMRLYIQTLLSDKVMGDKTKAELVCGVSRGRFYYYMKKPEFKQWYFDQCDEFLAQSRVNADTKVLESVRKGQPWALQLYYDLLGKRKTGTTVTNINTVKVGNGNGKLNGEHKARQDAARAFLRERLSL